MQHHQTNEVLEALAQQQLVMFIGARGTGKTVLAKNLETALAASSLTVIALDAAQAKSPADLIAPLIGPLGCAQDQLSAVRLPPDARIRVIVDNCDALNDHSWFAAVQDQWRGLLGEPEARGRVAFLLCGRPLFRRVAEGRGSPLIGIGSVVPSRPLERNEIELAFGADSNVAEAVRQKTGGHPYLSARLLEAISRDLSMLGRVYVDFSRSQRRYLVQLIDDHGTSTRAVIADLLRAARTNAIAESAVIARHFGTSRLLGQDTIEDLAASGLLERGNGYCTLAAELLRTDSDLSQYLAAPEFSIIDQPSTQHAQAAEELFRTENRLRHNVGTWLAEVDETWWPSRFPSTIVREVEQRRRAEAESAAPPSGDVHPIAYMTFGELVDVVLEEHNWERVFRVRFGMSREAFNEKTAAVNAVRNKVAHNRPVEEADLTVLQLANRRLGLHSSRDTN